MLVVVRSDQRHQVRNRHASQGDVNAPTLPLLGRQPSKESKSLGGQRSYGIKWLRGRATTCRRTIGRLISVSRFEPKTRIWSRLRFRHLYPKVKGSGRLEQRTFPYADQRAERAL